MQICVRFLIKCQKHPRSPKHSHAPFCKLMAHCAIQEPVHSALEQLMRVAFHRVIGIPYHAKHTTQTHFFCTAFPRQDAGCSGGPKSSNSSAKTCHGGCVLGGCGGPFTRRPQFAYLHTLILLSLHLPQVHSQRHHALSPDLPHKHCSCHTCHARAPTLIFLTHILATPATPTSTQHFTYILATPATHRITYAHIFWRRLPRRTTDTKFENKTKKQNNNFHKVRSNASLEALPCSLHPLLLICTVQFFDLWNCCGSERHPPKNPKLRLQHTWFLESGFVTIFSQNQDIKNNNGEFAILKLLWCASGHISLLFLDSRTNVFFSNRFRYFRNSSIYFRNSTLYVRNSPDMATDKEANRCLNSWMKLRWVCSIHWAKMQVTWWESPDLGSGTTCQVSSFPQRMSPGHQQSCYVNRSTE